MNDAAGTPTYKTLPQGAVLKAGAKVIAKPSKDKASSGDIKVFDYTNYREYLSAWFESRQKKNPAFSASAFVMRAGLGKNSRGYLKLIIEGKRNLSQHTIRAFSDAMNLKAKEAIYFENLVCFNQAKSAKDRDHYFLRLQDAAAGHESHTFELMKSQYQFCSQWYHIVIWELVTIKDFCEDPAWICANLKNKVTRREVEESIKLLLDLEMLKRDENGQLVQTHSFINLTGGFFNSVVQNFHAQMLNRGRDALLEDEYGTWHAEALTVACDESNYKAMIKEMVQFCEHLNTKYNVPKDKAEAVVQINFQAFIQSNKVFKKNN